MFAYALYDQEINELTIVRDRLGQKPIFYLHHEEQFIFCSEIKGLLKNNAIDPKLDTRNLSTFMQLGYSVGPNSPIKGISQIEPGCKIIPVLAYRNLDGGI